MKTIALSANQINLKSILIDVFGLAFIYFVPAISHLLSFPLYLVEPMRIMLVLAMVHTSKRNAYFIALSLPLFSFLVSAHPNFLKMLLITAELGFNVWLFYLLRERMKNTFISMLVAISMSKMAYYLAKFTLISSALLTTNLISTPLFLQGITMVVFSGYAFLVFTRFRPQDK